MKNVIFLLAFLFIANASFCQEKINTSAIANFHKTPKNGVEMQEDKPCTYRPFEPQPEAPLPQPMLVNNRKTNKVKHILFSETKLALLPKHTKR